MGGPSVKKLEKLTWKESCLLAFVNQIKRAAVDLFTALSEADQRALLDKKSPSAAAGSSSSTTTSKDVKGKGKAKAKAEDGAEDEGGEGDSKGKGKGKKKEMTEEEKAAAEVSFCIFFG